MQTLWIITVILLAASISITDARRSKRPLIRAHERERVPDTYFVHFRNSAPLQKLQQLTQELGNRSSQGGAFRASIGSIVTRAAYGFPAILSQPALEYVRTTAT